MKTSNSDLTAYTDAFCQGGAGGYVRYTELYDFILTNGATFSLTTWDVNLTVAACTRLLPTQTGNTTYLSYAKPGGPFIKRGSIDCKIGTDVSTMNLELYAQASNQINGIPVLQALSQGNFDNATVLCRGFFLDCPNNNGAYVKFFGQIGDINVGKLRAKIKVDSMTNMLNQNMPAAVYQASCRFAFGDVNCGFNLSTVTTTGTVTSGSNQKTLNTSLTPATVVSPPSAAPSLTQAGASTNLVQRTYWVVVTYVYANGETTASPEASITVSKGNLCTVDSPPAVSGATGWNCYMAMGPGEELLQNPISLMIGSNYTESPTGLSAQGNPPPTANSQGYYAQGVISFTSGPNSGLSEDIQGNTGGVITLYTPLPNAPETGDTFTIRPGCPKTTAACAGWFGSTWVTRFGGQANIPAPETGF